MDVNERQMIADAIATAIRILRDERKEYEEDIDYDAELDVTYLSDLHRAQYDLLRARLAVLVDDSTSAYSLVLRASDLTYESASEDDFLMLEAIYEHIDDVGDVDHATLAKHAQQKEEEQKRYEAYLKAEKERRNIPPEDQQEAQKMREAHEAVRARRKRDAQKIRDAT